MPSGVMPVGGVASAESRVDCGADAAWRESGQSYQKSNARAYVPRIGLRHAQNRGLHENSAILNHKFWRKFQNFQENPANEYSNLRYYIYSSLCAEHILPEKYYHTILYRIKRICTTYQIQSDEDLDEVPFFKFLGTNLEF